MTGRKGDRIGAIRQANVFCGVESRAVPVTDASCGVHSAYVYYI